MVRHSSSLSRIELLALLFVVASCSHARSRPSLADREAQCAPVWKAVHAEIDSRGAACSADWECREVRPEYLGCDAWANVGFKLSEGRIVELENACAPISFVPDCGARVGACVMGRCAGRRANPDAMRCASAKEIHLARIQTLLVQTPSSASSCRVDADCPYVGPLGERHPLKYLGPRAVAQEWHAVRDACPSDGDLSLQGLADAPSASRCIAGACRLGPVDSKGDPVRPVITRPSLADQGCLGAIQVPKDLLGLIGTVTVSFMVSTRGVPFAFQVEGTRRKDLQIALVEAISQCTLIPGRAGSIPVTMRMVLPIRFQPSP